MVPKSSNNILWLIAPAAERATTTALYAVQRYASRTVRGAKLSVKAQVAV